MSTKYTKELLEDAVLKSNSISGVLRYLGLLQAGGTQCHIKKMILKYHIDISHFTGQRWNKGKTFPSKLKPEDILVYNTNNSREQSRKLRKALLAIGTDYVCSICQNPGEWQSQKLVLQIDHINGDPLNNTKENLRFLCPNCHSQQSTFSRRKSKK